MSDTTFKFEIKDYQNDVINYGIKHPYFINAMSQGLGKTLVSIMIAKQTNSKTLVVCPSYLRLKWKSEIRKFYPEAVTSLFEKSKDIYKPWDSNFCIISYSMLDKAEELFAWADFVIIDESHMLKSMKAKRTEIAHRFIYEYSIKRISLLTGTPIQNRVYEFYSLITLCQYNPLMEESAFLKKFPSYVDFANYFSYLYEIEMRIGGKTVKVQNWKGYKNEVELKRWLENIYIRKSEDLLNLQPFIDIEVPVEYKDNPELLSEFSSFSSGDNKSVKSDVKLKAAVSKAPFTAEFVQNLLDQDQQVVVYCDHPESCKVIAEKLKVSFKSIDGTTPTHVRQAQADRFQSGEQRVIIATIGSFSTGIDLFSACIMVFNSPSWTPGSMAQVKSRIRRLGQKQRCTFYYIVGSYQDEYIYRRLDEKMKVINAIV